MRNDATFPACPAGCALADRLRCWLRTERQLWTDLTAARRADSDDAEVLASDLRAAGRQIDALLARARQGLR